MDLYSAFEHTPELRSLQSQEERDAVHRIAWQKFLADHPNIGLRGLLFVVPSGIACLVIGHYLLEFAFPGEQVGWHKWLTPLIGGVGCGLGALVHFCFVTNQLRAHYRDILAEKAAKLEQDMEDC